MARRIATGASSRAGVVPTAGSCRSRCSISARSTTASTPPGAGSSRASTRRSSAPASSPCFPPDRRCPSTPRRTASRCSSGRCTCTGRANGARAGSPASSTSNSGSIGSGRSGWRTREGTRWRHVLQTLVCYRLIDPGSEWRLHRQWFEHSAMADLLGADDTLVAKDTLYRCLDKLLAHKEALFSHLRGRWQDLFGASFEVLLYDLTSTYFESPPPDDETDKRRHGYSRDKRGDCVPVVIALIVTPEGFPLAYEVLPGNTADSTTLRAFLHRIETQYGRAQRIWVMDRGVPTEAVLAEMRQADPPVSYLVGTPKGRLSRMEQALLGKPWQAVRPGVEVKLLSEEQELYVLARSRARIDTPPVAKVGPVPVHKR